MITNAILIRQGFIRVEHTWVDGQTHLVKFGGSYACPVRPGKLGKIEVAGFYGRNRCRMCHTAFLKKRSKRA